MTDNNLIVNLRLASARCRLNAFRMVRASGHGHIGGALSAMDIVTALYFYKMNIDPANPDMENRDRFLLSAGHKCLAQYAVLAERGYFDKSLLDTYGDLASKIPGHPDMHKLHGIEANTGALGHGLSIAAGMAMASKLSGNDFSVYAITGDGELPEGSNWEAAAAASKFGLDNLAIFVDNNGLQISGSTDNVMSMRPIDEKFRSFGWAVKEIDGNDMRQIVDTLDSLPLENGRPSMILCKTVKGKGWDYGENKAESHFWNATEELLDQVEQELQELISELENKVQGESIR